ncbi:hypothetical protein H6G97_47230 [Nostoc flagelliforme FACHB-838]|uniref:Uncharacterized protein n=1 Tax=Nostoc flagelliforme FACHB-838 TaxID=2692904 RepID=A0ABR8E444_9NOSO|nr:hypothetical protein [Nostoc flagelliforme]MBD2536469.1 hypothetical protein [Nostoc flagelliforme FACHB-838]
MSHESILDRITRKSNLVSFKLEDIRLQVENNEVADVTVNLDYIDGLNSSELKNVVPIANNIKDYLTNYLNNPNDLFEVINRNFTEELLTDDNLGLSQVLDSLSLNLDVSPKIIPFQFDSTNTRTPNGNINDIISFRLEDITSPIDGGIVADITVNLDYVDGIDSSVFKDVIPIGNYIKDFLANYPVEVGLYEVLNRDLTQGLLNDSNIGLSGVLDSLSVNLDVSPKIIPFQFDSTNTRTPNGNINDIISFRLEDIISPIDGGIVADVTVNLDYVDGIDSSVFKDVIPIGNYIKDFLANYPVEAGLYEVLNRDLTQRLLNDSNIGLSGVLDSLSVNLDVSPKIIPFQFDSTNTRTPNGNINDIISFRLEDIISPIDGGIVADVTVNLDYVDGIDSSVFKDVIPIGNYIKDFLANYPVEAGLYEVLNRDLTQGLLNDSNIGLSGVLNSLSVNLDVSPKIIPFQFDTTITRTANSDINDIVSFQLEDILLSIDSASVTDVAVNLDYINGIDPSAFKDVIPLGNFIEDYLTNYSHPNDSFEVVNNNLGNALLTDSNLGLSSVLDSLTVTLGA